MKPHPTPNLWIHQPSLCDTPSPNPPIHPSACADNGQRPIHGRTRRQLHGTCLDSSTQQPTQALPRAPYRPNGKAPGVRGQRPYGAAADFPWPRSFPRLVSSGTPHQKAWWHPGAPRSNFLHGCCRSHHRRTVHVRVTEHPPASMRFHRGIMERPFPAHPTYRQYPVQPAARREMAFHGSSPEAGGITSMDS